MFKHILIPTDGSELSGRAVQAGVEFAKTLGAKVTGLYAMAEYPIMAYGEGSTMPLITPEEFRQEETKQAQKFLGPLKKAAQEVGVDCETCSVENGAPYKAIIDAATQKGCDVIFMASHGRRGLGALLLGSETSKVLTHSKIPVVVYR
jgi:nucleotide-binding universal stress UspA family protein